MIVDVKWTCQDEIFMRKAFFILYIQKFNVKSISLLGVMIIVIATWLYTGSYGDMISLLISTVHLT